MSEITRQTLDEDVDSTDEVPVLSEAEVVAVDEPGDTAGTRPRADEHAGPLAGLEPPAAIEQRVASLEQGARAREAGIGDLESRLGEMSRGWRAVEAELSRNSAAMELIAEQLTGLRDALREREAELGSAREQAALAREQAAAARERAVAESAGDGDPRAEVAALRAYITNRREHWDRLEAHVAEQARRIHELELELEQRVARQHEAEELASRESMRAAEYRDELTRLAAQRPAAGSPRGAGEDDADARYRVRELRSPGAPRAAHGPAGVDADTGEHEIAAVTEPADLHGDERGALVCLTNEQPERYAITKPVLLIGRGAAADIQIATHVVSREHARLRADGAAVHIEDLGSTNGVFVNAVRVHSRELHDGDRITIGETLFRYVASDPA